MPPAAPTAPTTVNEPGLLLNVAHTIARSRVNGPGERFVLWVQGCSLHCRGCWNPDTWSVRPRTLADPRELAADIVATEGIEGVTLTGGEPFEQAESLVPLVEQVRTAGLSVFAFSGYELSELADGAHQRLLGLCDVAVLGRYRRDQRAEGLPWRGSANQTVHFLTDRYGPADLDEAPECEVHIAEDGTLTVTGFPPDALR
ncbi:MAG TPA: 4Fe-4S single cluster domain-containing protein [Actinocrinis sp.]|nr:4Fe-4S single cluster domain-containing protein [Actinocrinis sp.]